MEGAVRTRNVKQTDPKQMVCIAENHVGVGGLSPPNHSTSREPKQAIEESRQAHEMILVLLVDQIGSRNLEAGSVGSGRMRGRHSDQGLAARLSGQFMQTEAVKTRGAPIGSFGCRGQ